MHPKLLEQKLLEMVREDAYPSDITTEITPNRRIKAEIVAEDSCVLSGVFEVNTLFNLFGIQVKKLLHDGKRVKKGEIIVKLEGNSRDILLVERTALNILSRMSGISTITKEVVERVEKANSRIRVAATRKTTPSFGYFEKRAVELAGGDTHRINLSDMILIKDNHYHLFKNAREAIKKAKESSFSHKIEIEVTSLDTAVEAALAGADVIMLDNLNPEEIKKIVLELERKGLRGRVLIEASGGINLENIEEYANAGVDIISLGLITMAAPRADFSLHLL